MSLTMWLFIPLSRIISLADVTNIASSCSTPSSFCTSNDLIPQWKDPNLGFRLTSLHRHDSIYPLSVRFPLFAVPSRLIPSFFGRYTAVAYTIRACSDPFCCWHGTWPLHTSSICMAVREGCRLTFSVSKWLVIYSASM